MRGFTLTPRRGVLAAAFAVAIAAAPAAHAAGDHEGGHGHDDGHGNGHGPSYGHAGTPGEVDRTVEVEARDIAFDREAIDVAPGETIRFVIRNTGEMRHEFTVGPPSVQKDHRQEMREMMQSGEGMSHGAGHGHANSVMVGPGETAELIWHFEEVENLRFGCNVPGHYQAGMHGGFSPAD